METKGKNYQKEFEEIMYNNDIIKPWSLSGFRTNPISLDCALEEIANIWGEDARFREGFLIDKENNIVNIPHLYVRIKGVKTKFGDNDANIIDLIQTFNTNSLHINMESNPSKNGNLFAKHIQEKLDNNEDLDIGDIPNNGWFHKLNGTIQSYILTKLNGFAKENKDEYDIPNIVKNIGFINKDFAKALNDWQFYNNVPKVFVKDTDGLSLQALEWLDFLSCLGFDIMLFSPMGELLPEKKNHYKDIKEFTLDKFDMEYKEYNDEETYYIRKLTSSFNSLDLSIFALMTTLLIGFFVLRVAIPDLSLATPNENIILIPVIVIMILAIILGIPGTFKENKLIKQNEGIKAFTKAYHDCLDGENELIAYIIVALFYVLVFSIIIRWYKFSLFCIICGIIYVMIYEKNKMQIKKIL